MVFHIGDAGYNELFGVAWGEDPTSRVREMSAFQWAFLHGDLPIMQTLGSLVYYNLFGRFPDVRVVSIENGSDWVEYLLKHLDKKKGMGRQGPWPGGYFRGRAGEILREHLYLTPYPEDDVLPLVELMGADHVLFGSDYPASRRAGRAERLRQAARGPGGAKRPAHHGRQQPRTAGRYCMTDLGDRLIGSLAAAGIDAVFGVPGGQTLPLYRAARETGFRHVLMRDERSAACAADAYARVRGHVGVCDATVGPGVTNLVSGLAEAYASSIPVLAVVADIRSDQGHLRRRSVASQAAEQNAILAPVTKWVARVERAAAFDDVFAHALRVATTGRPGPVALEIPEDVFTEAPPAETPVIAGHDAAFPRFRPALGRGDVERISALLADADRPVLLAGGGVLASGASEAVLAFAETTGIPVATTIMGKGAIDERHELSLGVVGTFGCFRANAALIEADAVLVIGSKLDQLSTIGFRMPRRDQRVAHIDIDGEEIGRVTPVEVGALADAREALAALTEHAAVSGVSRHAPWFAGLPADPEVRAVEDDGVAPDAVVKAIGESFPAGATLVSDASLASGWVARYLRAVRAGRSILAPRGLAGIGWSGGAAIGAAVAAGGSRVVALAGDGAWGYAMAEVETAARLRLPITYVILNNASYGWVAHTETERKLTELSHLGQADYAAAAAALGAKAWRARSIDEFTQRFSEAMRIDGPTVVEVLSSPTASPTLRIRDVVAHGKARR